MSTPMFNPPGFDQPGFDQPGFNQAWRPDATQEREDALLRDVLGRRVIAFLVDALLLSLICMVLWVTLFSFGVLTLGLGMPLLGLLPLVPLAYNWLALMGPAAATPGQALLGLTVRRDADLATPDAFAALVWALAFYATIALGAFWLAFALVSRRHRALHDVLSGLVVVRARALTRGPGFANMHGGRTPFA